MATWCIVRLTDKQFARYVKLYNGDDWRPPSHPALFERALKGRTLWALEQIRGFEDIRKIARGFPVVVVRRRWGEERILVLED